jgi:phosphoesterase RecJ-like protein
MSVSSPPPELVALLQARASFVLAVHKGPDGDAAGSALGLYHALRGQGKDVQVVAPTPVPQHYLWLPGAEQFAQEIQGTPEAAIALDCDGLDRVGGLQEAIGKLPVLVNIDHHGNANPFGDVRYTDRTVAATAQLVYRLLQALGWPVTAQIATCLYTGIATDTGFFHFENTDASALREASELVAAGASPTAIAEAVSETRSLARTRLLGRALQAAQMDLSGRIVYAVLSPQDFRDTGTGAGDTEGIVDALKQAEGQQAAVLLKAPERDDQWQLSLRSRRADVAAVARQFGGGGHARAAGCDANGSWAEVSARVLAAVQAALDEAGFSS